MDKHVTAEQVIYLMQTMGQWTRDKLIVVNNRLDSCEQAADEISAEEFLQLLEEANKEYGNA